MKIAYIAHPVSGDVKGNIEKILKIVREINLNEPNTVPFVPYLTDLQALDDNVPSERERGFKNNKVWFDRQYIDEIRLYGSHISRGMAIEIEWARHNDILIKDLTDGGY